MLYIQFQSSPLIERLLGALNEARSELDPYAQLPDEYTGELRRHVLIQSVHYSTRIEGNILTLEQVETVLSGGIINAPQEQIQEVENYRDAIAFIQTLALTEGARITEETIRTIHFLVSKNLPGSYAPSQYRTQQNFVVDRITGRRIFLPPSPDQVPMLMRGLVDWLNTSQNIPTPIEAALCHLNFAAIHPFFDGNGRTARVLESLVMYLGGFKSQELVSLEAYFGQDNRGYYSTIASALGPQYSPPRDVTRWVEYHLQAHVDQAQAASQLLRDVVVEMDGLWEAFQHEGINWNQVTALWLAATRGRITNREYRTITGRSAQTAVNDFTTLMDTGLLTRTGRGRSTVYLPTQRVIEALNAIRERDLV